MDDHLPGHLLVATPAMHDANFDRTVVLLIEHGDEGALGVVLTRPSDYVLDEIVQSWRDAIAEPGVAFVGGPVSPLTVIAIANRTDPTEQEGFSYFQGSWGTLDLSRPRDELGGVDRVRIFTGYAGWGPGQLEREIASGAWLMAPAGSDDPFTGDPGSLWARALQRALELLPSQADQPWLS